MANATRSQLEQAFNLIQQEKLDQAIAILKPITTKEPNNGDAWWLMANAVSEPEDAHNALQNVLRLNPANDEARELLNQLEQEFPQLSRSTPATSSDFGDSDASFDDLFGSSAKSAPASSSGSSSFSADDLDQLLGDTSDSGSSGFPMSSNVDDLFSSTSLDDSQSLDTLMDNSAKSFSPGSSFSSFDDPFSSSEPGFVQDEVLNAPADKKSKPRRGRAEPKPRKQQETKLIEEVAPQNALDLERKANSRPNPMVLAVLLLTIAALVGVGIFAASTAGLLKGPQPAATAENLDVLVIPANDVPAAIQAIKSRLTAKGFGAVSASVVVSPIGDTFQVQFCDKAAADLAKRITTAQDLVAQATAGLRDTIKGAGIDIVSCANPSVRLYRAVSPIAAITSYVDGGLKNKRPFKASWVKS